MINKCLGCGVKLQATDIEALGYAKDLNHSYCHRCFRIKHYGEYKEVAKTSEDFMSILNSINKTKSLVVVVIDLFNIPLELETVNKYLNNDQLLVLTKRDLFANDYYDKKFFDYIKGDYIDKVIVSSVNNYNFDNLYDLINHYRKSKNVYVVGFTNAGKSTLINKLIYNYSNNSYEITTSILPSTTLGTISIDLNEDLTLIDTPGLIDNGNISNVVGGDLLKKIIPSKLIKPITYQVREHQYIMVDKLLLIESSSNNLTVFCSTELKVDRYRNMPKHELVKHEINAYKGCDIVINGLAFIKVMKDELITIYTLADVSVYTRESLI